MGRFFSFQGRIGRLRFWLSGLGVLVHLTVLLFAFWAYALSQPGAYENGGPTPFPTAPLGIIGFVIWLVLLVAALVLGFAIVVKRLHDRAKPWWWIGVFVVVPNALWTLYEYLSQPDDPYLRFAFLPGLLAIALYAWAFVELGILRGTIGSNAYGPDPAAAD